ncbi:MAG: hypothetical protein DLM50_07295 [Candidatus Meridianibacter frigidus]|nr:MAG: hypothetical protein DLM50_07295 [Candidatus Eremiobacteraeota bacterium]
MLAMCDGFGTVDGEPIAQTTLRALHSAMGARARGARFSNTLSRPKSVASMLISTLAGVNAYLYRRSASHDDYVTCGASMSVILLVGNRAYLAHVGNTAAYLSRSGYMISLTKDDSFVFDVPTGGAVAVSAHPPVLMRALGTAPQVELSVCNFRVAGDDAVVLSNKRFSGFEDRRALSGWMLHGRPPVDLGDRTVLVSRPGPAVQDNTAGSIRALGARPLGAGIIMFLLFMLLA